MDFGSWVLTVALIAWVLLAELEYGQVVVNRQEHFLVLVQLEVAARTLVEIGVGE